MTSLRTLHFTITWKHHKVKKVDFNLKTNYVCVHEFFFKCYEKPISTYRYMQIIWSLRIFQNSKNHNLNKMIITILLKEKIEVSMLGESLCILLL